MTEAPFQQDNSLRGRLAARRRLLREKHPIDIPVPGYEKDIIARYQVLDYHVLRRIGKRSEDEADDVQAEINVAADTLANACIGLFEVGPDGKTATDTGHRWSTAAAKELFEVGENELPPGTGARDAILAIFATDTSVVQHYADYSAKASNVSGQIDGDLTGESVASSEDA